MKLINKFLILNTLFPVLVFAENISIDSIGLNIGSSKMDYSQTNNSGAVVLGNEPNKVFNTYEIHTTLNNLLDIDDDIKPYFSYTYSNNSELKHQYFLVGLNKSYKYNIFNLEGGVIAGYGELNWKYNPLNNTTDNDYNANSFIAGVQGSIKYPLDNKISLGLNAKYLLHSYDTQLKPNSATSATIHHDNTVVVSFGITYTFGDLKKDK